MMDWNLGRKTPHTDDNAGIVRDNFSCEEPSAGKKTLPLLSFFKMKQHTVFMQRGGGRGRKNLFPVRPRVSDTVTEPKERAQLLRLTTWLFHHINPRVRGRGRWPIKNERKYFRSADRRCEKSSPRQDKINSSSGEWRRPAHTVKAHPSFSSPGHRKRH